MVYLSNPRSCSRCWLVAVTLFFFSDKCRNVLYKEYSFANMTNYYLIAVRNQTPFFFRSCIISSLGHRFYTASILNPLRLISPR